MKYFSRGGQRERRKAGPRKIRYCYDVVKSTVGNLSRLPRYFVMLEARRGKWSLAMRRAVRKVSVFGFVWVLIDNSAGVAVWNSLRVFERLFFLHFFFVGWVDGWG